LYFIFGKKKKYTKKRRWMKLMNEIEQVYIKQKNIVLHDTKICIALNKTQAFWFLIESLPFIDF
jgi:hypothetical protein